MTWQEDFVTYKEAYKAGQPVRAVDLLWERSRERAKQKAARAACAKCSDDERCGAHPWHDDGTPGPGRQAWQRGGRYAPPGRPL